MSYRRQHIKPKIHSLRKKKKLIQKPWFWIVLLIITIIAVLAYFVLFSPKFQNSNIEISGNQNIKSEDIKNFLSLEAGNRIFLIKKNELKNKILSEIPLIESITIKKQYPNTLNILIKEREYFAVFCENESLHNCFEIDKNGVIYKSSENINPGSLIITNEQSQQFSLGSEVIQKNIMDMIAKTQKNLVDNFQIDIKNVFVSNPLIFKTSENWKIYFDPTGDIDLQITKMNLLLKDEIPVNVRKNLQYIYLQYKDRAYYK